MRKSLIMGTKEDVIKRRANKPVRNNNGTGTSVPVRRIVTFNHPDAFK